MALKLSGQEPAFQFKGGALTVTTLELLTTDALLIEKELEQQTRRAPAFFRQTPVVLAFERLEQDNPVSLDLIVAACKRNGLIPIAVRCALDNVKQSAWALGLGWFPPQTDSHIKSVAQDKSCIARKATKFVHGTVRSGQQVYADCADLVVLGSVNEGAEVIADGNVHIWGVLRGKAIAGAQGDQDARVICQQFKAELVSVSGIFQTFESYSWPNSAAQLIEIYLDNERLVVKA
ncbi:septum site-determining protein MinC [Oceanospirillum multiglobuliferum]|uniref:Probable septum site-determining protein MinC n=1 Tax=Oceanospirillum multiglobuliferum TaxID=64969 RepID=A0A1T4S0K8_9GAMM|nr:septum site-determining protein MinC [Oceanospirillum multiglobuliferum]OPX54523.1 septum site-determining protein MinC [Oceanospirillum multiglobuliferum]SKA21799.1 septum site-determining protein MinC [Oceanospirillum multiglobuliferum]